MKKIFPYGKVKLYFTTEMMIPPDLEVLDGRSLLSETNSTKGQIFNVQVERGDSDLDDQIATSLNFTWNVINFEKQEMDIQIKFSNPEEVSSASPDTLVIQFIDPSIFMSTDGIMLN